VPDIPTSRALRSGRLVGRGATRHFHRGRLAAAILTDSQFWAPALVLLLGLFLLAALR
jgi:hypothetical protein